MVIPAKQAAIIMRSLRNYEKLKPAYVDLKRSSAAWHTVRQQDSIAIAAQGRVIEWWRSSFAIEQQLRQDADKKVVLWRGKARRRGLVIGVGIALPVLFGTYQVLK